VKRLIYLTSLIAFLTACANPQTPEKISDPIRMVTPIVPEGAIFLDACTHSLSYPPSFVADESLGIFFQAEDESDVFLMIDVRRRWENEQSSSLEAMGEGLAQRLGADEQDQAFEVVQMEDHLGLEIQALKAEFSDGSGNHLSTIIALRPETLLMDMLPEEVVFEITASAPDEFWEEWAPQFDVIFNSFRPAECGGI
jgi:hypothetical protein